MADKSEVQSAIATLCEDLDARLSDIEDMKRVINSLSNSIGEGYVFKDTKVHGSKYASHEAPSSAALAFFQSRGKDLGPATAEEVYRALKDGGFDFGSKSETGSTGGLRIAMRKDRRFFIVTGDDEYEPMTYGLVEWGEQ